jgi:hypothetical protein
LVVAAAAVTSLEAVEEQVDIDHLRRKAYL